jgi:hypothetical protein
MARVATFLLASNLTPILDTGVYNVNRSTVLPATGVNNGDYVPLFTIQRAGRIIGSKMNVTATLGAGAIVTLALYRAGALVQNLSAASTAAAASIVTGAGLANVTAQAGDEIVLVASGANITASATADVDVHLQH